MAAKPIRIFFSELSRRFYASAFYRIEPNGLVTITGQKFDVTNDIGALIEQHAVTFERRPAQAGEARRGETEGLDAKRDHAVAGGDAPQ